MKRPGTFRFLRVTCKEVRDYSPQKSMVPILVSKVVKCQLPIRRKLSAEEVTDFLCQASFML
jgi:hypothetical protein